MHYKNLTAILKIVRENLNRAVLMVLSAIREFRRCVGLRNLSCPKIQIYIWSNPRLLFIDKRNTPGRHKQGCNVLHLQLFPLSKTAQNESACSNQRE